jgi:hypothetical protein
MSQRTEDVTAINTNQIMLYRKTIDVGFDIHTKEANTFWTTDRLEGRKLKDLADRCDSK